MTQDIKDTQPLVSVVIPTYNRSKELARAIKSVLIQTHQNFEILVVDDGSEEKLKEVCDFFNDSRIRFLRNDTHTNANVARNRGIKEALGEYIAMLDSDDEYLPHHLNRRIEKIKKWDCDGIFGSALVSTPSGISFGLSRPLRMGETMGNYLLSDGSATTPSLFFKREVTDKVTWDINLERHQDYDFCIKLSKHYQLRCDTEATIQINWNKSDDSTRKYDFTSCIKFIEKYEGEISRPILVNYFKKMLYFAKGEKDNFALRYYQARLKSLIFYLSFSDWVDIHNGESPIKFSAKFIFSILRLLIQKAFNLRTATL